MNRATLVDDLDTDASNWLHLKKLCSTSAFAAIL
jgi:hypothetical protein